MKDKPVILFLSPEKVDRLSNGLKFDSTAVVILGCQHIKLYETITLGSRDKRACGKGGYPAPAGGLIPLPPASS
jgi:hypothetical protein